LEDFSSPRDAWHGKSKARLLVWRVKKRKKSPEVLYIDSHWHSYTTSLISFGSIYRFSLRSPWNFGFTSWFRPGLKMQPSGSGDDVAAWWSVGQTWCLETGHMALHVPRKHKLWISEEIFQRDSIAISKKPAAFLFGATKVILAAIMVHHVWWSPAMEGL
jgi:hypothetical protein